MQSSIRKLTPTGAALGAAAAGLLLAAVWSIFKFSSTPYSFMPHRTCYLDNSGLIWLHVVSDTAIGIAYVSISLTLAYLVKEARVPFHLAFLAFGVFIGACGMTHFMEVWTIWEPRYWLAGGIKVVTALASVATAIWLFPLLPQAFALVRSAEVAEERRVKLAAAHEQLETTHSQLTSAHQELKSMYDKMKELDELKTSFFSNVSHELRTPLTLILGPTRRVLETSSLSANDRRRLETVERNAGLLLNHVNDLLDLSKLDARKMEVNYVNSDLAALLRSCAGYFESLAVERKITLRVIAPEKLMAQADADKLQRVLFNLLSNAFKFTPDGGTILCRLTNRNDRAVFEVQDNGPGIPAQSRQTVFERFKQLDTGTTRRAGGTGLGLSIAKEFVELQKGSISISDTPGGGATFTIEMPLKAPEGAIVAEAAPSLAAQRAEISSGTLAALRPHTDVVQTTPTTEVRSGPLVLVVEDNREMNAFLYDTLTPDYRVEKAYDGKQGLEKAKSLRPDLIISDVMMPEMSGAQLLAEIKATPELKDTPVVLLTAKTDDELRVQLLKEGAQDYIMKPPVLEELRVRVANLVSLKRSRDLLQKELARSGGKLEELAQALVDREREVAKARAAAEAAGRAKDEFLMTLSHELRTPLTPLLGWTRMLRGGLEPAQGSHALSVIERNVLTEMKLIEDLLDMSRIATGKLRLELQNIEIVPCIESAIEAISPAAKAKSITIRFINEGAGLTIMGDPTRIQQIVWNLLSNAAKFTPKEGQIEVHLTRDGDRAKIRVSDSGEGIDPAFMPWLFNRFSQADSSTTRKHGGLGIGLSIVRKLVELHGGDVRAESGGSGKGANFIVTLPVSKNESLAGASSKIYSSGIKVKTEAALLKHLRILIVDDELDAREMLSTVLERQGAETQVAASVDEALTRIEEFHPQVLVSDIAMPGDDGYALLRKIREKGLEVHAIAVTAYARNEDRQRALSEGYQIHLGKPVDPAELVAAVSNFISST